MKNKLREFLILSKVIFIALVVSACVNGQTVDKMQPSAKLQQPPLPADLYTCNKPPYAKPQDAKTLNAGEVERLWSLDRARLAKVNKCYERVVKMYEATRNK